MTHRYPSSYLKGHRLGGGIDPVAGAPQGEAGDDIKGIGVRRWAEGDLKLAAEGAEGYHPESFARQLEHHAPSRRGASEYRAIEIAAARQSRGWATA
jgi:hypothetical protein